MNHQRKIRRGLRLLGGTLGVCAALSASLSAGATPPVDAHQYFTASQSNSQSDQNVNETGKTPATTPEDNGRSSALRSGFWTGLEGISGGSDLDPQTGTNVYSDPDHADVVTVVDDETGLETEVVSGITHWVEAPKLGVLARGMARAASASAADVLSVRITPNTGSTAAGVLPTVRIDITVPATAKAGDVYVADLNVPWVYPPGLASGLEIKDAHGTVFAVAKVLWVTRDGAPSRYASLEITLTDAAESHAEVIGFIQVMLSPWLKSTQQLVPVILTSDGVELGRSGTWTVAGEGPATPTVSANGGVYANGQPQIEPYIRIAASRVPAGGWTVTLSKMSSGLSPVCDGAIFNRAPNANGFIVDRIKKIEPVTCTATSASYLITRADLDAVGATTTYPVTFRTSLAGALPATYYTATLSSSLSRTPSETTRDWIVGATTGVPPTSGADGLYLLTEKSASFTTIAGSAQPSIGDTVTYTITTTPGSTNSRAITGLITTDVLPQGLEFVSASGSGTYDAASRKVTWGPRILTSTGKFTDTISTRITSIPASKSLVNTVENVADSVCSSGDTLSTCSATVTTPVGAPGFTFKKSSEVEDTNQNGWVGDEGDTIKYLFTVTNTGDVNLTGTTLTDDLLNLTSVACLGNGAPLAPGQSRACLGSHSHIITAADVTAGSVTNHATLCVNPALGLDCKPSETTTPTLKPSYEFTKQVVSIKDPSGVDVGEGEAIAGDTIHYGFTATNTGNADIPQLFITDPLLGADRVECLPSGQILTPSATVTCVDSAQYDYTVTDQDVDAGQVHNVAVASVTGLPDQDGETTTPLKPPAVDIDLPLTGSTGTWLFLGLGMSLILGGGLALARPNKNRNS